MGDENGRLKILGTRTLDKRVDLEMEMGWNPRPTSRVESYKAEAISQDLEMTS
jgi:hypothetical protein